MGMALLSAQRSKDPSTQVGACIVGADNKIIGLGYNGFPVGCADWKFPWGSSEDPHESKYSYVVHAEANAILNSIEKPKGSSIYTTLFPCNECAKLIIQAGIKEVHYLSADPKGVYEDSFRISERMFENSDVRSMKYNPTVESLTLKFR